MTPPVMNALGTSSFPQLHLVSLAVLSGTRLFPLQLLLLPLVLLGCGWLNAAETPEQNQVQPTGSASSPGLQISDRADLEQSPDHEESEVQSFDSMTAISENWMATLMNVSKGANAAAILANNAWILSCAALVFFMIAPGLALFYSGLVRKKNVLSVFIQCLFLTAVMSVVWALYGYSLAFSDGHAANQWIGGLDNVFLIGVSSTWNEVTHSTVTPMWFSP